MAKHVMYICGCSMEMEIAEEMGWVGKCRGCLNLDFDGVNELCKGEILTEHKENCPDWIVDHR